ncbi:MAG: M56 family metallopeptidase [Bacteroidales bacterium]|nr:M56 family metallopeptidase [Bacteroidales bacterium]MDZ4203875.1 M56 family metallopeptidase [Bacteroidales bacterium]
MNNFSNWLIYSALALVFFYGIYLLFMRRLELLKTSRLYLLATIIMAVLIPLPWQKLAGSAREVVATFNLHVFTVLSPSIEIQTNQGFSWADFIFTTYFFVAIFLFAFFLYSNIRIYLMIRRLEKIRTNGVMILLADHDVLPFSWFGKIVISRKDFNSGRFETILSHERTHIRQYHFIDLLIVEVLTILHWFNPAIWMYRHSIRSIHEYLADREIIRSGFQAIDYQRILAGLSGFVPAGVLTNNMNHSLLKNRFIMMTKTKPGKLAQVRLFSAMIVALLVGCSVFIAACQSQNKMVKSPIELDNSISVTTQKQGDTMTSVTSGDSIIVVDESPTFLGGEGARIKYLIDNIRYPETARLKGVQGVIFVSFVVEADGAITNIKILRGIGSGCDEEAVRVVSKMPKWNPGKLRGQPVRVQFVMPFKFSL